MLDEICLGDINFVAVVVFAVVVLVVVVVVIVVVVVVVDVNVGVNVGISVAELDSEEEVFVYFVVLNGSEDMMSLAGAPRSRNKYSYSVSCEENESFFSAGSDEASF